HIAGVSAGAAVGDRRDIYLTAIIHVGVAITIPFGTLRDSTLVGVTDILTGRDLDMWKQGAVVAAASAGLRCVRRGGALFSARTSQPAVITIRQHTLVGGPCLDLFTDIGAATDR